MSEYAPVVYSIDSDNLITDVNAAWGDFLSENSEIGAPDILGRSLLDFVSGKVTRQFWLRQFDLARERGALSVEYRCDAPGLKRWMRMELRRIEGNGLRIFNELLASEKRPAPVYFLPATQRGKDTFICCSLCSRIKDADRWCEPDGRVSTYRVTYGLCQDCA